MIGRRGFLKLLAGAAAGFTLDPDLALWVPGKVKVFDLGAVPAMVDTQVIDGILKDVYMPFIMEQLNESSLWGALVLDGRGRPYNNAVQV